MTMYERSAGSIAPSTGQLELRHQVRPIEAVVAKEASLSKIIAQLVAELHSCIGVWLPSIVSNIAQTASPCLYLRSNLRDMHRAVAMRLPAPPLSRSEGVVVPCAYASMCEVRTSTSSKMPSRT